MPASKAQTKASLEEVVGSLRKRATDLWGPDRAGALRPLIEATAGRIWRISQCPPPDDEEPGFYM
jgi:hypothetical protein